LSPDEIQIWLVDVGFDKYAALFELVDVRQSCFEADLKSFCLGPRLRMRELLNSKIDPELPPAKKEKGEPRGPNKTKQ